MGLADAAFHAIGAIHTASDRNALCERESRLEAAVKEFIQAGAAQVRAVTHKPRAGLNSGRAPDGGSGPESTWNLGDLVNDLKQVSKLIGRGIRTDVD